MGELEYMNVGGFFRDWKNKILRRGVKFGEILVTCKGFFCMIFFDKFSFVKLK